MIEIIVYALLGITVILAVTTLLLYKTLTIWKEKALNTEKELKYILDLYNHSPCGYHSLNSNGVFIEINNTELDWLGYKREEIIDKLKFSDILTPASLKTFQANFPVFKEKGIIQNLEFDLICKNGNLLPVILSSIAVKDKNGNYLYGRSTIFNNEERKKAEQSVRSLNQELERNNARLRQANKDLESFSYSVSHDLRAPLRSVNGYSQVLLEDYADKLDDEARKVINVIINNAQKMGQLIDDLLAFSRYGKQTLVKVNINMEELVNSILNEQNAKYSNKKTEINLTSLFPAHGDYNMMKQVMINLLSNAFKYSNKRDKIEIEIGSYKEKQTHVYYIKDNGAGFDMQYYDKLFGVFQRLHSLKEFEGTGVGLAIVHRIITKHHGKVWAEGKVDSGACFYFSLPVKESKNINP